MKITLENHTVKELVQGYLDSAENGVTAFNGKLNVRPPFQREFVYGDSQRKAVINTILKGFPLNIMYWSVNSDGNYELLDGQQRTISICQYVTGDFHITSDVGDRFFGNLTETEKEKILNYELSIYVCDGSDKEKLDWFKIINIAGEELTPQELRNAVYTGSWLADAKRYFSKTGCVAYKVSNNYVNAKLNRQELLEKALEWIADRDNTTVELYMAKHQHDTNATELWLYFDHVFSWVKTIFPNYRKEMKSVEWGILYNSYGNNSYDPFKFEDEVKRLMQDDDVQKKSGIYEYLLSNDERKLSIRAFTDTQKRKMYEQQNGKCPYCKQKFEFEQMEGDHIKPWIEGGATVIENLQMLCKPCNRKKSSK